MGERGELPAGFNPRAREGRDAMKQGTAQQVDVSIHAPARGATAFDAEMTGVFCGFNPRAREGRDVLVKREPFSDEVSIHAPARGAT